MKTEEQIVKRTNLYTIALILGIVIANILLTSCTANKHTKPISGKANGKMTSAQCFSYKHS